MMFAVQGNTYNSIVHLLALLDCTYDCILRRYDIALMWCACLWFVWLFLSLYLLTPTTTGAFLIPYAILLMIAGLPLMFMELSFGQYAALGPIAVYHRFCPFFQGLGVGMIMVSTIVMLYYNVIISWTIYYMFASIRAQLPWQNCDDAWSTRSMFISIILKEILNIA